MALGALFPVTATILHRLVVLLSVATRNPVYALSASLIILIGFLILSSTFSWYLVAVLGAALLQAILQLIAQQKLVPKTLLTSGKLLATYTKPGDDRVDPVPTGNEDLDDALPPQTATNEGWKTRNVKWTNLISLLALFSGTFLLTGGSMVATYRSAVDETEAIAIGSTFLGLGAVAFAIVVIIGCCCYRQKRMHYKRAADGEYEEDTDNLIWNQGLPAQLKYWFLLFLLLSAGFIIQESTRSATVSGIGSDISFVWHLIATIVMWAVFAGVGIGLKLHKDPLETKAQVGWFVLINSIHDLGVVVLGQGIAYGLRNDSNADLYTMIGFVSGSGAFALIDLLWIIFDQDVAQKASNARARARDGFASAKRAVAAKARQGLDRAKNVVRKTGSYGVDTLGHTSLSMDHLAQNTLGSPYDECPPRPRSRSQSRGPDDLRPPQIRSQSRTRDYYAGDPDDAGQPRGRSPAAPRRRPNLYEMTDD